jgi:hypothetical protein
VKKRKIFLLANAEPTTIGWAISRLKPIDVMIGMRISEATVWETKVATVQQKKRTQIRARKGLDKGKTTGEETKFNKKYRRVIDILTCCNGIW